MLLREVERETTKAQAVREIDEKGRLSVFRTISSDSRLLWAVGI